MPRPDVRLALLHSPLLGPASFAPLVGALHGRGVAIVVPDLRGACEHPPFAERWAELASAAVRGEAGAVVLVAHSGAGRLLRLVQGAAAWVLMDAGLPGEKTHLDGAPEGYRARADEMADAAGRLPPWTSWWGDDLLAQVVPDPVRRAALVADTPSVPLGLLHERIPARGRDLPAAYLSFTYEREALEAERRGWPVERLAGGHLHHMVAPDDVADALLRLLSRLGHGIDAGDVTERA